MSRRPAAITQADVARVLRAAQACGGWRVEILPGGVISLLPISANEGPHVGTGFVDKPDDGAGIVL